MTFIWDSNSSHTLRFIFENRLMEVSSVDVCILMRGRKKYCYLYD